MVGAADYNLTGGEYLLFGTSTAYPVYPLIIGCDEEVFAGTPTPVFVGYVNTSWGDPIPDLEGYELPVEPLAGATVYADGDPVGTTNENGIVNVSLPPGEHILYADKPDFIRSESI